MRLYALGVGLAAVLIVFASGCKQVTAPTAGSTAAGTITFDETYGVAPAAGWKWGVAAIDTDAQEITESSSSHSFAWAVYVVRGSTEIGTAAGTQVLSAGQAALVPAGQAHTHRFPPQSRVLLFRPADRPFGDFHRGTRLYESSGQLAVTAGQTYNLRIREQTVGAWSPVSGISDTGFAYLLEGAVLARDGAVDTLQGVNSTFGMLSRMALLTTAAGSARVLLVDLH